MSARDVAQGLRGIEIVAAAAAVRFGASCDACDPEQDLARLVSAELRVGAHPALIPALHREPADHEHRRQRKHTHGDRERPKPERSQVGNARGLGRGWHQSSRHR